MDKLISLAAEMITYNDNASLLNAAHFPHAQMA